jgi:predicted AAA+ superfamily ATPase
LEHRINWNNRLLGIIGARGTGKTTLILQHLADQGEKVREYLYVSADHIHVQGTGIYEIAATFFRLGGKTVIFDEVHKYTDWSRELKNLYDSFPDGRIVFSGSSTLSLQKGKADLSRRSVVYTLPGLSFREYLSLAEGRIVSVITLDDLLRDHRTKAEEILSDGPILGHFARYLDHGVYPFFLEGLEEYVPKLLNVVEKVLYEDIPATLGVRAGKVPVLKRILWLVATSQPFSPNIEKMSRDLATSKEYIYTYLDALERAALLLDLLPAEVGYRLVRKPAKMYLENTNLLRAVAGSVGPGYQSGSERETFFAHQVKSAGTSIRIPVSGDFLVNEQYVFEVGGKNKGRSQIKGTAKGYVVRDDIEIGFGNVIPLWMFGLLY